MRPAFAPPFESAPERCKPALFIFASATSESARVPPLGILARSANPSVAFGLSADEGDGAVVAESRQLASAAPAIVIAKTMTRTPLPPERRDTCVDVGGCDAMRDPSSVEMFFDDQAVALAVSRRLLKLSPDTSASGAKAPTHFCATCPFIRDIARD